MPILTKEEVSTILRKTLEFSKADECEVTLNGAKSGNNRYARNTVSTAGHSTIMSL
jgi:hypothetical protein